MDCRRCHERFRADKVIEDWCAETGFALPKPIDAFTRAEMKDFVEEHTIPCPTCGKHNFTDIRQFNLMFKTFRGVTEDAKNTVYLRPETAQGIFVNFNNVQRTTRKKLPFGIGRIGKSFRNEITPETSFSACASLSRWSWSSSASPAPTWNGSSIGVASATTGCSPSDLRTKTCACVTTIRRSCASTQGNHGL